VVCECRGFRGSSGRVRSIEHGRDQISGTKRAQERDTNAGKVAAKPDEWIKESEKKNNRMVKEAVNENVG
jgi:hypothetical protein